MLPYDVHVYRGQLLVRYWYKKMSDRTVVSSQSLNPVDLVIVPCSLRLAQRLPADFDEAIEQLDLPFCRRFEGLVSLRHFEKKKQDSEGSSVKPKDPPIQEGAHGR